MRPCHKCQGIIIPTCFACIIINLDIYGNLFANKQGSGTIDIDTIILKEGIVMTDKIDQNRKQIAASKKRIETLQNQVNDKDTQLEKLKQEIVRIQKEKLDIRRKQNSEKRKNRTRAMCIFAAEILNLFPQLADAEKGIYTLGEYQELYNTILEQVKSKSINFNVSPNITPPDAETLVIIDDKNQIVIPNAKALKARTVSLDQKALLIRAWEFLTKIFTKNSNSYSTQQINERIRYYVNSENPSTIIDDYQTLNDQNPLTLDDLMSLHEKAK